MSELPPGFVLDQSEGPAQGLGLPPGFTLDQPASPGLGGTALDVVKQLGSGAATGVEAIPGTMPTLMNFAGEKLGPLIEQYAPWLAKADPAAEAQRKSIMQQGQQVRADTSVTNYLPQPQTDAGCEGRCHWKEV